MFLKQAAKKENTGKDQGFTLIEVLIAIFVFTIGILAVASMQVSALMGNSVADRATIRTVSAQSQLEQLIALPYDHTNLEAEVPGNPPETDSAGNPHQVITTDGYTIRWDVNDNDPIANAKRITMRVTAPNGSQTVVVAIKAS